LTPTTVFAHGTLQSLNKTTDKYILDVFYDPLDLSINGSTILTFYLKDISTKQDVPITSIWVKIAEGQKILYSGPVGPRSFGPPAITYAFPKAGQYEISARFEKDDQTLEEGTFALTVNEFEKKKSDLPVKMGIGVGAFVTGSIVTLVLTKLLRKKKKK